MVNNSSGEVFDMGMPEWGIALIILFDLTVILLAFIGNGIILMVEIPNKQKTSTDWIISFMAINDIILAGCDSPFHLVMYSGHWDMLGSNTLCGISTYVQNTFSYSSTLLLTLTALDRYLKTCRPLTKGITANRALSICNGITIFTLLLNSPVPFYKKFDQSVKCRYHVTSSTTRVLFDSIMVIIQGTYALMFIIVIFSYTKVAITVRQRNRRILPQLNIVKKMSSLQMCEKQTNVKNGSFVRSVAQFKTIQPHAEERACDVSVIELPVNASQNENNGPSTSSGNHNNDSHIMRELLVARSERLAAKEARSTRLTIIMFIISVTFILSWIPVWVSVAVWPLGKASAPEESVAVYFTRRLFIINTFANPIFYISMSSNFRTLVKEKCRRFLPLI